MKQCAYGTSPRAAAVTLAGHKDLIAAVPVADDGGGAILVCRDGTVRIWDLDTGGCRTTVHAGDPQNPAETVAIAHDGRTAVLGYSRGLIRVWDLATGQCRHMLTGHQGPIQDIAMSADSLTAVSSGMDGTLRTWNLESGECRHIFRHPPPLDPLDWTTEVTITEDGREGVVAASDRTLLTAGQEMALIRIGLANCISARADRILVGTDFGGLLFLHCGNMEAPSAPLYPMSP